MSRQLTASRFVTQLLADKNPLKFFWLSEGEHADPRDASTTLICSEAVAFMWVPGIRRPLAILDKEGRQWLQFRYFRRTKRVAPSRLIGDVARTLAAIAIHSSSPGQRDPIFGLDTPSSRATP